MQQQTNKRGRLIVLTAPSGAGKTTLVRALLERLPDLEFSISFTTRPRRESEREGQDYFFVSAARFERMVHDGEFLEHARVFGHWYGTSRRYLEERLDAGRTVLLEIDWQGARQIRDQVAEAVSVFILPPSINTLERRLKTRGTDSDDVVDRRLGEAVGDMSHWAEFDHVLVNDDLPQAADALTGIVSGESMNHRTALPAVRAAAERIVGGGAREHPVDVT